jgi:hypothetical protein
MTAFDGPISDSLISPGHGGPVSFGGRLDQVVPATPSEQGFITDATTDEPVAGAYPDAVQRAFKEDRRGSACETLPRVGSPRPVEVARRFSLPGPVLATLPFGPRMDQGPESESWVDFPVESGSEYQPQDDDSGSEH